jgi:hypothetical protein
MRFVFEWNVWQEMGGLVYSLGFKVEVWEGRKEEVTLKQ